MNGAASAANTPRQDPDKFLALMDEADDTSKRRDELKSDLRRFKDVIEKIVDLETQVNTAGGARKATKIGQSKMATFPRAFQPYCRQAN